MVESAARRRIPTILAACSVVGAGLVALVVAPAQASPAVTLDYSCTNLALGNPDVEVTFGTDLPATLGPDLGAAVTVTTDVTFVNSLRSTLYDLGYRSGSGSATGAMFVNDDPRVVESNISDFGVDAEGGSLVTSATGTLWDVVTGEVGSQVVVTASTISLRLDLLRQPPFFGGVALLECVPKAGQDLQIAAVDVVDPDADPTTPPVSEPTVGTTTPPTAAPVAKVSPKVVMKPAKYAVRRGGHVVLRLTVAAPGARPTGRVKVKVGRYTKAAALHGGAATIRIKIPWSAKPGKVVASASYGGDARVKAGKAPTRRITIKK